MMRELFHGWRRKAGCITLVIACALMGLRMRSSVVDDVISFEYAGLDYMVLCQDGAISVGTTKSNSPLSFSFDHFSDSRGWLGHMDHKTELWKAILPLTLLSAYLILWKPRKQKSARTENGDKP